MASLPLHGISNVQVNQKVVPMRAVMTRLLLALWCLLLLSGCGDGSSTQVSSNQTRLLATSSTMQADYASVVQQLYVAYFGRPADPAGLTNFEKALLAANAPTNIQDLNAAYATSPAIKALIDSFGTSAESARLYGSGTTADFVGAIYQNVLGRTPLPAGSAFWADAISSGSLSQGNAALAIMAGALANTTAQGILDGQLINNRLTVANYFTAHVASQDAVSVYKGTTAAASARTMLDAVVAGTDTTPYESTVDATVGALFGPAASTLEVFAGNIGGPGSANGTGTGARFYNPSSVATDSAGNVYVADYMNYTVRKITPAGVVTTLAGTAGAYGSVNGTGAAANFTALGGIATDSADNVYVSDTYNYTIRKITPAGVVTTLAGAAGVQGSANGTGAAARFNQPRGIATDSVGNVYVADFGNNTIRKITPAGVVSTLAGTTGAPGSVDGIGTAASFYQPNGIATDSAGNVYVADIGNNTIRKITPAGVVSTLAGTTGAQGSTDGTGGAATFNTPWSIATDSAGNVYVADTNNNAIRMITPDRVVTTVAGTPGVNGYVDGIGADARFYGPMGVAIDGEGNVIVADSYNNIIRKITPDMMVTTLAGNPSVTGSADGTGSAALFDGPNGVAADSAGNVYVADTQNDIIRKITPAGVVTTLAGKAGAAGSADGTGTAARFMSPSGVATDSAGNVYVADTYNHTIRRITPAGVVTTLAGNPNIYGSADGTGGRANFSIPYAVATDGAGNVYVADIGNQNIRKITPAAVVTTLAGTAGVKGSADGTGAAASFNYPYGIATDSVGNVYVADSQNNIIRKINPAGVVTTLAGELGVIGSGNGTTGTVAGTGTPGDFNFPKGIAVDSAGNVYVADANNHAIRKITPDGTVSTPIGEPPVTTEFVAGPLPGRLLDPSGIAISGTSLYIAIGNGIAVVNNLP